MLVAHGIGPTAQRVQIAEVLLARPQHLSADQILASVNRGGGHVSKATVYNTLKLFHQKGMVREIIVDPSRVFYDSTTGGHHHFYNVDSGELSDIKPGDIAFERLPELPPGTETDDVEVIVKIRRAR